MGTRPMPARTWQPSQNARWNALLAYYTHDFNDQTQPHAFSLRVRGEIFEDAGGVRTCVGGNNFNGGTNVCAGVSAGGFVPGSGVRGYLILQRV